MSYTQIIGDKVVRRQVGRLIFEASGIGVGFRYLQHRGGLFLTYSQVRAGLDGVRPEKWLP